MGAVVIGTAAPIPTPIMPLLVELAPSWSAGWVARPDVEVELLHVASAGHDLDRCILTSRYGRIKQPWETSLRDVMARDLIGCWVRLSLIGTDGSAYPLWVGRVSGGAQLPCGPAPVVSGQQQWVAYGPLQILQKIHVSTSYWEGDGGDIEVWWLPPMNERKAKVGGTGNRGGTGEEGCYLYGGDERWSNLQYLQYLLVKFANEGSGPQWSISGQYDILSEFWDAHNWGASATIAEMISKLIPTKYGVDYSITATDSGFAINVFSLASQQSTYGWGNLPANPNVVRVISGLNPNIDQVRIVASNDHGYNRIRVVGKRVVVCGSLGFANSTLEGRWSDALESEYMQATMSDEGSPNDEFRRANRFEPVFQAFGAPSDWCDSSWGLAQTIERHTLSWLPLQAGVDYTGNPPIDSSESETPEFLQPMAWLYTNNPDWSQGEGNENFRWVPCQKLEPAIGVHAAKDDWGVLLRTNPNHNLAEGHWDAASASDFDPLWDYEQLACTIAIESDVRLSVEKTVAGGYEPSNGCLVIEAPDAEYWYLVGGTVVGIDADGLVEVSPQAGMVLRDDSPYLQQIMAGAIARYYAGRFRGEIHARGFWPWSQMIGAIIQVISDGGSGNDIRSPITSITWSGGQNPGTVIKTGYAG